MHNLQAAASAADLQKLDESILGVFQLVSVGNGGLVHPQFGLLWPASLPGSFVFLLLMSLLRKNMFFDEFSMIVLQSEYNLSSNRGTTYKTGILDPIEFLVGTLNP